MILEINSYQEHTININDYVLIKFDLIKDMITNYLKKLFCCNIECKRKRKLLSYIINNIKEIVDIQTEKKFNDFTYDIYIPSLRLAFIFDEIYDENYRIKEDKSKIINISNKNKIKVFLFDIKEIGKLNTERINGYKNEVNSKIDFEILSKRFKGCTYC